MIRFCFFGKLHISPVKIIGWFIVRFKSWGGFKLLFQILLMHSFANTNIENLVRTLKLKIFDVTYSGKWQPGRKG